MLKTNNPKMMKKENKDFVLWELFFKKIVQNIDSFVIVTDSPGKIVFTNKKFNKFFDFKEKELKQEIWKTIVPDKKFKEIHQVFLDIKKKKIVAKFISPVKKADNSLDHFSWLTIPLKKDRKMYYFFIGKKSNHKNGHKIKVHRLKTKELVNVYKEFIDHIFSASMISEPGTASHAARVMQFAVELGKRFNLKKQELENLKAAALLHDLGKLVVDEEILFKKGKLNKKEFEEIKKHPFWAAEVVKMVYFLYDVVPIMSSHHEYYNGKGYPLAMDGDKIPLESRILSVADIYEALIADRPYRKGYSVKKAIAIMEQEKGVKLDPEITDVFLTMVRKGEIKP